MGAVSIEKVFLFFANPQNLPCIMPPANRNEIGGVATYTSGWFREQQVDDVDQLAGVGSEIVTSFRPLPFIPWRTEWIASDY